MTPDQHQTIIDCLAEIDHQLESGDVSGARVSLSFIRRQVDVLGCAQDRLPVDFALLLRITTVVAEAYSLPPDRLFSSGRPADIAEPRQVAMFCIRELTPCSTIQIGEFFNKDHSTITYACAAVRDHMEVEPQFHARIQRILQTLSPQQQEA